MAKPAILAHIKDLHKKKSLQKFIFKKKFYKGVVHQVEEKKVKYRSISISWLKCSVCTLDTAVSCEIQMKVSGKQVFQSFWAYYPLYGYKPKSSKVYFYK